MIYLQNPANGRDAEENEARKWPSFARAEGIHFAQALLLGRVVNRHPSEHHVPASKHSIARF
jgi:hypothetical protein